MNNADTRAALEAATFKQLTSTIIVEGYQQKSHWYSTDPAKVGVELLLVEDLTQAGNEPKVFIYSDATRWIPINIGDLT